MDDLASKFEEYCKDHDFMLVEGAGGLMVPYNDREFQIDLMKRVNLPVILVAEDRLGAINQVLLSVNELRRQGLIALGVVLMKSKGIYGNAELISRLGNIPILGEIKSVEGPTASGGDYRGFVAEVECNERIRGLFGFPKLP